MKIRLMGPHCLPPPSVSTEVGPEPPRIDRGCAAQPAHLIGRIPLGEIKAFAIKLPISADLAKLSAPPARKGRPRDSTNRPSVPIYGGMHARCHGVERPTCNTQESVKSIRNRLRLSHNRKMIFVCAVVPLPSTPLQLMV